MKNRKAIDIGDHNKCPSIGQFAECSEGRKLNRAGYQEVKDQSLHEEGSQLGILKRRKESICHIMEAGVINKAADLLKGSLEFRGKY